MRLAKLVLLCAVSTAFSACDGGEGDGSGATAAGAPDGAAPGADGAGPDGGRTTPVIPATHPRILLSDAATRARLTQDLATGTPAARRFKQMVDRQVDGGSVYAFEPWFAALVFQLTGDAKYATYAVEATDEWVANEERLIAEGSRPEVAGDSYLEVGDRIGNVALVFDFAYERLTPAQRERWLAYANQAVWNVWNHEDAKWGDRPSPWSGWSVDNPSNNYFYSFLRATMLLGLASHGESPRAVEWIDTFRKTKLESRLFPTFTSDLEGGGSREGTGYGTAMKDLFRLYDWWERSTTERIADRTPHTYASLFSMAHSIVPTLDRLTPTGDHSRDQTAALFDYHRDYLQVLGTLFSADRAAGVAKSLIAASSVPEMDQQFMFVHDFLYDLSPVAGRPLTDLATAYFAKGTGQISMRSSWEKTATYANFICGPYTESHAHRDQGSFVLFRGSWLAYDQNMASSSGIEQEERMHNLVRIEANGAVVTQVEGSPPCEVLALSDNADYAYAVARVTPVYGGKEAVASVERELLFVKPDTFVVFDRVSTNGARRVWTLNLPAAPTVNGDLLSYVSGASRLDVRRLAPAGLTTQVVPWEGMAGARVDVADTTGTSSRFLHVLGTNGSVTAAARSDGTGSLGAQITLADGRTLLVRFADAAPGGTIDLKRADGSSLAAGALPTTVTPPPLFSN